MWELDCEEGWALQNWCFWTVVLKTRESPLDCKIQPVHPRGDQSWVFIGRTDAKAKALIHWLLYVKSQFIGKDPDGGKDWRQEEKVTTEDDMVGWHRQLNRHEFEETPGDGKGQGNLECWVHGVAKSWTWLREWTTTTKKLGKNWSSSILSSSKPEEQKHFIKAEGNKLERVWKDVPTTYVKILRQKMCLTIVKGWRVNAIIYIYICVRVCVCVTYIDLKVISKGYIQVLRSCLNWLGRIITKPWYWDWTPQRLITHPLIISPWPAFS